MKTYHFLGFTLGLFLTATITGMNQEELKQVAAKNEPSMEEADVLVARQTPLGQLPRGVRRIIDEYSQGHEECFTSNCGSSTNLSIDNEGKPSLFWSKAVRNVKYARSDFAVEPTTTHFSPLQHKKSNAMHTDRFKKMHAVGKNLRMYPDWSRRTLNIVREDGTQEQIPFFTNSIVYACSPNTIAYAEIPRHLMERVYCEKPLVLEKEVEGVKIFKAPTRNRVDRRVLLASAIDKKGVCWVASTDGLLWNTDVVERGACEPISFDAQNLPPLYCDGRANSTCFLMYCDDKNELHLIATSSKTPGTIYDISVGDGKRTAYTCGNDKIAEVLPCGNDSFAVRTEKGLYSFKYGNPSCSAIAHEPNGIMVATFTLPDGEFIVCTHYAAGSDTLHIYEKTSLYKKALMELENNKKQ